MLRRADIEAVFILTGPGTHARFTVQAAEAGKHILLQKPMATTLEDANAIVTAVRAAASRRWSSQARSRRWTRPTHRCAR